MRTVWIIWGGGVGEMHGDGGGGTLQVARPRTARSGARALATKRSTRVALSTLGTRVQRAFKKSKMVARWGGVRAARRTCRAGASMTSNWAALMVTLAGRKGGR
jgi:hypothetical protein